MNAWATAGSVLSLALAAVYVGDMTSAAFRAQLDRLPHCLLGLAVRRLDDDIRYDVAAEWAAELDAILHQHHAGPVPLIRLLIGTRFAAGLLRSARITSGYLAAKPQLLDAGLRSAFRVTGPPDPTRAAIGAASQFMGWLSVALLGAAGFSGMRVLWVVAGVLGVEMAWKLVASLRRRAARHAAHRAGHRATPAADPMTSTRQEPPAGLSPHGPTDTITADGSDARQPPSGPAIRDSATRDAYRRYQRRPHRLLASGTALLVVSVVLGCILSTWSESRNQRLYAAGALTDGRVAELGVSPNPLLFPPRVVYAYQVAGEPNPRRASVRPIFPGNSYQPGDRVSVVYDPADPARATIVGEDNQSLLVSMAAQLPTALSGGLLGLGFVLWLCGRRLRKDLTRADWRPYRYHHIVIPGRTAESTRHVLTLEPELTGPWVPLPRDVSPYAPASNRAWTPTGSAWVAGDPRTRRRLVIALPGQSDMALYRASRPRPDVTDRILATPPPPT